MSARPDELPGRHYGALSAEAIAALDPLTTVIVLPIAATEQHGSHLPLGTDSMIGERLLAETLAQLPKAVPAFSLPQLEIANSVEHTNAAGTLSFGSRLTMDLIIELGRSLDRAGLRKMLILNAHGGNVGVMVDAAHALRQMFGMLCVYTNWARFGLPTGLLTDEERAVDIHGGAIETSIMMAARADLVDPSGAEGFASLQSDLGDQFELLRAYGPVGMGWMGTDLNPTGTVGQSNQGTAEMGARIVDHQARKAAQLIGEVSRYQPTWF